MQSAEFRDLRSAIINVGYRLSCTAEEREITMKKADIGLIGLAVMGENLAMNMESKGFTVAVFNRETEIVDKFINGRGKNKNFIAIYNSG